MFNSPYQNTKYWFEGVVENRFDPLEAGRVQVRVFGIHSENLVRIPSEELLWMQVDMPTTSAGNSGVSQMHGLVEGSHVRGYFRDGEIRQQGVVESVIYGIPTNSRDTTKGFNDLRSNLASVPGYPQSVDYPDGKLQVVEGVKAAYPRWTNEPDITRLARGKANHVTITKQNSRNTQTSIKTAGGGSFAEPAVPFAAQYPYNMATEYESGHALEFDNTPGHERVHLFHRVGSFIEMHPNGDVVNKSSGNQYNIAHGGVYDHAQGTKTVTVEQGYKLLVNASSGSNSYEIEIGSSGDLNINVVNGNVNLNVTGDMIQKVSGDYSLEVGGRYVMKATRIDFNPPSDELEMPQGIF